MENEECLRIRVQKDKNVLSYKKIIFGNQKEDIHLIEHETEIQDLEMMKQILNDLNIHEVITLHKKRESYIYQNKIEISFDEVKDLGFYIELEIIDKNIDIKNANVLLKETLKELNLSEEDRNLVGYANELYSLKYRHE